MAADVIVGGVFVDGFVGSGSGTGGGVAVEDDLDGACGGGGEREETHDGGFGSSEGCEFKSF